jgi:4-amino-4-deoxy-L-arabinose transferase-like glycosyltransferase
MKRLHTYLPAISVFCLALLVRILYDFTIARDYTPKFDAAIYNILAHNMLVAHCYCMTPHYSTVFRPPLWPFIIATIYFFVGEHSAYIRLFYCLLGSGTCVLVYLFAKRPYWKANRLDYRRDRGNVYGPLHLGWLVVHRITLYFLLTAFAFSLYRLQQSAFPIETNRGKGFLALFVPWRLWMVMSGILLGLAALARPNGSLLVGLLCVWAALVICAKLMPWQAVMRSVLVITLIATVLNAPWMYRNYTVTHSFFMVVLVYISSVPVFLLAALGLVVTCRRRKKQLLVVYLVIALTITQNIVFYGSPRFRAPIEPLLVVLVGGALSWLSYKRRQAIKVVA